MLMMKEVSMRQFTKKPPSIVLITCAVCRTFYHRIAGRGKQKWVRKGIKNPALFWSAGLICIREVRSLETYQVI